MIRWPWKRRGSSDLMAVSWSGDVLAYVHAVRRQDGLHEVRKFGVESRGTDSLEDFASRLAELELDNCEVRVMLRPEQYQVLQIDAPAVPPEELRSAARWQIKEMLDVHVDDITLDVMRVGDGQQKSANHLFVVVATNAQVRSVLELGDAMNWTVPVIDIQARNDEIMPRVAEALRREIGADGASLRLYPNPRKRPPGQNVQRPWRHARGAGIEVQPHPRSLQIRCPSTRWPRPRPRPHRHAG